MAIASNKIRVSLVLEKTVKKELEKLANADERSINYLVNKAVKDYIKKAAKNKPKWLPHRLYKH